MSTNKVSKIKGIVTELGEVDGELFGPKRKKGYENFLKQTSASLSDNLKAGEQNGNALESFFPYEHDAGAYGIVLSYTDEERRKLEGKVEDLKQWKTLIEEQNISIMFKGYEIIESEEGENREETVLCVFEVLKNPKGKDLLRIFNKELASVKHRINEDNQSEIEE